MKFREIKLETGAGIILGKDEESNEELVKKFRGKVNVILHTAKPGSPFCVIEKENPASSEIRAGGVITARYSQDWRNNKSDIKVNVFTGKDVYKLKGMPTGTFGVKKSRTIIVKKEEILKLKE